LSSAPELPGGLTVGLTVSGDGLGAKLRIAGHSNEAWKAAFPDPQALKAHLVAQGIAADGIRENILVNLHATLGKTVPAEREQDLADSQQVEIAHGQPPLNEEPIGLAFHKSYLANAEAIADLRRKSDAEGMDALRGSIDPAYWVSAGTAVLSWQGSARGQSGKDVFGAPIPGLPLQHRLPPFGKSLQPVDKRLVAVCEGVLIVEDGLLKVFGGDSLPACQVTVSGDRMAANLVLGGNAINDWSVTLEMVHAALKEQQVICMLPESEVQAALSAFNQDRRPRTLLIARGRPPVPGDGGRMELLVDPEPEAPKPGKDGSIDFKAFSFFRTVSKGERLARIIPPTPGRPGMDVHGKELPPPPPPAGGRELGKNTALDPVNPAVVLAARAGRLAVKNGAPEVVEVLDVAGDVSLKTGHINFPGAVKVAGDVHGKMEIEAAGDVEVDGTVEDSVIRTDGAIVIKGGVNGLGNGLIKSRFSSVTIGYLHNQRIESASHIEVYNEIISSQLYARKNITMKFGRFTVLGDVLMAGESIDLFNVGSESGVKTLLEVGKDFEVEAEMAKLEKELLVDTKDEEFLKDMDNQLTQVLRLNRGGSDEDLLLQKRTQGALEILARRIAACRKAMAELDERLYFPGLCEVVVRGTAYPGTVIKYRDYRITLSGRLNNRKWIFREKGPNPPMDGFPG
jgi:uncharacterized protein (DUF342 family)